MVIWRKIARRRENVAAVDVGWEEIKVIEIELTSRPTISLRRKLPTPPGVFNPTCDQEALAQALKRATKGLQSKRVVSCLRGDIVITRQLELPLMPKSDLKKVVGWEARKYIPLPLDQMVVHHASLGKTPQGGRERVLLVAVANNEVNDLCGAFTLAGINLVAIDLQAFALWRLYGSQRGASFFNHARPPGVTGTVAVADIGARTTNIVFMQQGKFVYCRAMGLGARHSSETGQYEAGSLLEELYLSLAYYKTLAEGKTVDKLIITGGGSKSSKLFSSIAAKLDIEVERSTIGSEKAVLDPAYSVALGLVLREVPAGG